MRATANGDHQLRNIRQTVTDGLCSGCAGRALGTDRTEHLDRIGGSVSQLVAEPVKKGDEPRIVTAHSDKDS
jgi:putative effector of murein hydrolase